MGHTLNTQKTLQFEPTPRAVFAARGIPFTHDPKVVLRATRALTVFGVAQEKSGGAKHEMGTGTGKDKNPNSRLIAMTSQDGGDTFGEVVTISQGSVAGHGENAPSVVLGSKGMCALWEEANTNGGGTQLFASSSSMGNSWSKPVLVTDKVTPNTNSYASLATSPNGDVYAVWLDGRNRSAGTLDIYIARSEDGGKSFGPNQLVAKGACPCCRPVAGVTTDGRLHVAWRHVYMGSIRDIALVSSPDQGKTFTPPVRVAVDNWYVEGCPHSGPTMAVVGNKIYLAWHSEGKGKDTVGVRVALSGNAGKSFHMTQIISRPLLDANHPMLVTHAQGQVYVTFQAREPRENNGWGTFRVYLADVTNFHASVKTPLLHQVPGKYKNASYPVVLPDTQGRFWCLWSENSDTPTICMSRARA
jgi:hypothetical protein